MACMQYILLSSVNSSAASFSVFLISSFTAISARDVAKSLFKLVAECLQILDIMFNRDAVCSVDIYLQNEKCTIIELCHSNI